MTSMTVSTAFCEPSSSRQCIALRISSLVGASIVTVAPFLKRSVAIPSTSASVPGAVQRVAGWSGVAKWAGVPMREICELVRPAGNAKWVVFYSFSDGPVGGRYYDCHPIASMYHDLTILAYEMNGEPLNESHGAR